MTVQSIKITDGSTNTSSYMYGDNTGDFSSIKATAGESKVYKILNQQSTYVSVAAKFNKLSTGAKIGIACGVIGTLLIALIGFVVFCVKSRRQGKREKAIADQRWDENNAELMDYRQKMAKGGFAQSHMDMGHGEKF